MKLKLKKDIIIKAGTIFDTAAQKVDRDDEFVEATFGLTKNTYGTVVYDISRDFWDEWAAWFEPVTDDKDCRKRRTTSRKRKRLNDRMAD